MEYTEQQRTLFKESFRNRRRYQLFLAVPLAAVVIGFALTEDRAAGTALGLPVAIGGPIFFVAVAAALVFSLRNWRCPACNKYLGRAFNPRHCHNCGVELRA